MPFIKTKDGTEIFYKDWGKKDAQPIPREEYDRLRSASV